MASQPRPTPTPYQVLARKFRPQSFDSLIGQEHVKITIENAIAQGRIAHGYIFSGQRGTGKTTVARILARCLNCVDGPTAKPCGVCSSCLEIAASQAPDVIEIDAASNRGINEMRELRDNVRYRPARDRYKVFIIDEAHQITSEAFNALLKTLEEPPEWVVFVLCTTEAHKIPATIASRCQHFSFRSVDFQELVDLMARICRQEQIEADSEVLTVLALAGEGSVRDSLSALDQAIACCGSKLNAAEVRQMLGVFSTAALQEVAEALRESDPARMLAIVDRLERQGQNLQHFSRELSRYIRNLLVAKIAGAETRLIAASDAERQALAKMAAEFSEEDLTRYLQIALDLFRDLQYSLQPRLHLELGLLRMAHAGRLTSLEEALAKLESGAPPAAQGGALPRRSSPSSSPHPTGGPSASPQLSPGSGALPAAPTAPPISAAAPPPAPQPQAWTERLREALTDMNRPYAADAVAHSQITENGVALQVQIPKMFRLALREQDLAAALTRLGATGRRIAISFVENGTDNGALQGAEAASKPELPDEVTQRALAHPEIQRYRELFGGEVRQVRNLRG